MLLRYLLSFVLVFLTCLTAEEPPSDIPTLDTFYITGTRLIGSDINSYLTGILRNDEDIRESNPTGMGDFLREFPGMHVVQSGVMGMGEEVFLHGGESNFTVVIVDGIRLNNPMNIRGGSADFSLVDPWAIESVSLITGTQSSIHGSDSLNGVIAMNTLDASPDRTGGYVRLETGTKGYMKAGLGGYGSSNEIDWKAGYSWLDEGGPTAGAGFKAHRANFGIRAPLGERTIIQINGFYADSEAMGFPDDSGGPLLAEIRETDEKTTRALAFSVDLKHRIDPDHQIELLLAGFDLSDTLQSPGVGPGMRDPLGIPGNDISNDFQRLRLQVFDRFTYGDRLRGAIGGAYNREDGESESVLYLGPGLALPGNYDLTRQTWSGFAEMAYAVTSNIQFAAEIRWDNPDSDSSVWSPRLSGAIQFPSLQSHLDISAGSGFKLPSFFALGNPLVGNPDLSRERADSISIVWSTHAFDDKWIGSLRWFGYRYEDLVDFFPGPPPILLNRENVEITGLVLQSGYAFSDDWHLSGNLTWQEIDVEGSSEPLLNRPEWRGFLRLYGKPMDSVDFAWTHHFVGERKDSSIPTGDKTLSSYYRSDLTVGWKPLDNTEIRVSIDNIFNRGYEERIGFPGLTRRLRVLVNQEF